MYLRSKPIFTSPFLALSASFGSSPQTYANYINGKFVPSTATTTFPINNPATQEHLANVPQSTQEEYQEASKAALAAYKSWSNTPILSRQRFLANYLQLLKNKHEELAKCITAEQGKTIVDAMGDVQRGIEVVEQTLATSAIMMGETSSNLSAGIDGYSLRVPLGVCAGIAPFNFPVMIPLWMFPLGVACGNTYIMKPSERVAGSSQMLAELVGEAGFPSGVVNMIHGGKQTVDFILDDPIVKSVSFVGSNRAGEYIYNRGSQNGKRVQSNLGAKNPCVIMPDANQEDVVNALVGAAFGASGQRCMALSVAIFVGKSQEWIDQVVEKAKTLKVGPGSDPDSAIGPLISPEAKARVISLIESAKREGANVRLDGSGFVHPTHPQGNFVGPTLISGVLTF